MFHSGERVRVRVSLSPVGFGNSGGLVFVDGSAVEITAA
jgi:hypothetical protein